MDIKQLTTVFLQGERDGESVRFDIAKVQLQRFIDADKKDKQAVLNNIVDVYADHCEQTNNK